MLLYTFMPHFYCFAFLLVKLLQVIKKKKKTAVHCFVFFNLGNLCASEYSSYVFCVIVSSYFFTCFLPHCAFILFNAFFFPVFKRIWQAKSFVKHVIHSLLHTSTFLRFIRVGDILQFNEVQSLAPSGFFLSQQQQFFPLDYFQ